MGLFFDTPKSTARATKSNDPVTLNQLAEVEENILKQLDVLEQRLTADADKKKTSTGEE